MHLVVIAHTAPVNCVYCRDRLADPVEGCEKCGTLYHDECAKIAGSCSLIGCHGVFGKRSGPRGRAEDARLALAVRAPAQPTPAQLAAVARALGVTEWDARQRLGAGLPVVLGYFPRPRLGPVTADLEAADLSVLAIDARVLAARERFLVRSVDAVPDGFLLRAEDGREERLRLGEVQVAVSARYATVHDQNVRVGAVPAPGRKGKTLPRSKMKHVHTETYSRVFHVYRDAVPFVFDESVIDDFRFLGERMSPSASQNLIALVDLLGARARLLDRSMEQLTHAHMHHAPDSTRVRGSVRTNRAWVDATSLLIFHAASAEPDAKDAKKAD